MASANINHVRLHELTFKPFLSAELIDERVREMGQELGFRLSGGSPTFLIMLKGAFVFAADLIRASRLNGEIGFVRTQSYHGMESSGDVRLHLAPEPALVTDRDVVLIEDIVDSGYTMQAFLPKLHELKPR